MAYLHWARCDLQIEIDAPFLHIDYCPRCLVGTATISPMILSGSVTLPGRAGDRHEPFVLSLIYSDQRPRHGASMRLTAIDACSARQRRSAPRADATRRRHTARRSRRHGRRRPSAALTATTTRHTLTRRGLV